MKAAFIYILICPITGRVRYVGKTTNPKKRFCNHLTDAKKEKNYRANWIRSLTAQGLKPIVEIIAQVPDIQWPQWEIDYIAAFRSMGCDLVNGTDGGEGFESGEKHPLFGKKQAPETCAKISATLKGVYVGEKNHMFGKKQSPEHVAKRVARNRKAERTPEWRAALSAANRGQKRTPEQIAKNREVHIGLKHSPETKAKMSLSAKAWRLRKN